MPGESLQRDLAELLNYWSADNSTPAHILAKYLIACLAAHDEAVKARAVWHGEEKQP